ncbi:RNA polymerase subunit sigma [Paracoccus ravus]|uniref:RNA polymerase subunit sigma n=1 Tax=Paracoccus ravus TaxID=2447760 RepID=UPI001430B4D4|nr:RNA polymerase subunit sigma [Paracoccus ravus]
MPDARSNTVDDLIARTASGDREAFDALYAATSARIYALCLSILKDRPEAEAALQRTYVEIWRQAKARPDQPLTGTRWLTTLARTHALGRQRQRRIELAEGQQPRSAGALAALPAATASGARAPVLAALNEEEAMALREIYLEGLSYQDLASRESVTAADLRRWLRGALSRLSA